MGLAVHGRPVVLEQVDDFLWDSPRLRASVLGLSVEAGVTEALAGDVFGRLALHIALIDELEALVDELLLAGGSAA